MPDSAVDDHQIEPAVVVVVHEPGAKPGESKLEESELRGAILEQPAADIEVERVPLVVQIGDEQILIAISIDVADVDAHAPLRLPRAAHRHTCQQRIVRERARPALR